MKLIVIAKEPRPGLVKTRLSPPFTPEGAAALASAALEDTIAAAVASGITTTVAFEGEPTGHIPPGLEVIPQRGPGLAERLASAFEDAGGPALLIGMDTPQVTPAMLTDAVQRLTAPDVDAVLGRAPDGGYWAIGLKRADRRIFEGVPMSSEETADRQLERLEDLGLRCAPLAALTDVDDFLDAAEVALVAPGTNFAELFNELAPKTGVMS